MRSQILSLMICCMFISFTIHAVFLQKAAAFRMLFVAEKEAREMSHSLQEVAAIAADPEFFNDENSAIHDGMTVNDAMIIDELNTIQHSMRDPQFFSDNH
ncbi:hypothetical protein KP509_17G006800 [Ceratopteris richardii]|uniref:Uncharacterized protein n=1 Tax=Ceratopteris richardii TaxID=49495 RepID=A0A8T2SSJ6_CERRI|nr:hypothetical protein KP509_17G006800 [Ceratopteris richardii]